MNLVSMGYTLKHQNPGRIPALCDKLFKQRITKTQAQHKNWFASDKSFISLHKSWLFFRAFEIKKISIIISFLPSYTNHLNKLFD